MCKSQLHIDVEEGECLKVDLASDGQRQVGTIFIDGVRYHIEKIPVKEYRVNYRIDMDNEYEPHTDADGCCVIVAPFSK
ncbi:MAG: hypothetical protein RBT37_06210 [Dissulfurispiraceae bacterium]|jgi:hypothetical protein|nr:hypothetical protein [Dissulfurispiraceae bacterium]